MDTTTRQKREAPISYRPPAALGDEFHNRVQKSGLTVSGYITKAVFDETPGRASRVPAAAEKMLAKLLAEAAAIRQKLHEVEMTGAGENAVLLEQSLQALEDTRAALFASLRRKP